MLPLYGAETDEQHKAEEDRQQTAIQGRTLYPFSQKGNFEMGGVAGMPSGINARWWIVDIFGIDFTLGSTIRRDFVFTLDFLFEHVTLYRSSRSASEVLLRGRRADRLRLPGQRDAQQCQDPCRIIHPVYKISADHYRSSPLPPLSSRRKSDSTSTGASRSGTISAAFQKYWRSRGSLQDQLDDSHEKYGELSKTLNATKSDLDKTAGELDRTKGDLDATKGKLNATKR